MPGVEHAVFFISVSIVGAWCQCFGRALILKTGFFRHYHSWTAIAVGVVLGSLAFSFEKFLLVEMPRAAFLNPSASSYQRGAGLNFGAIFLQDVNGSPTWLGYICFFAIWQGIQFWNLDIILHREAKRSLKSTIMAGVMAFVTTLLFPFPQKYAVLWALTISATVQLASTWTPNSSLTRRG